MHSFRIDVFPAPGSTFELPGEEAVHLFRILRARPGEQVKVLDGHGTVGLAEVLPEKRLKLLSRETVTAPEPELVLVCAAPRRQKLDVLLKQAAELGVRAVHLMHCARSVAKPEGAERWQSLLMEACKQSGNPFLPEIQVHENPAAALDALTGVLLYYGAVVPPEAPFPAVPKRGKIAFLAGPEGGFTAEEEALFRSRGAVGISLGPWILRLETAAVAGLAALRAAAV